MTANQRRPGFRLPWSSETEDRGTAATPETPAPDSSVTPGAEVDGSAAESDATTPAAPPPTSAATPTQKPPDSAPVEPPPPVAAAPTAADAPTEFLQELVAAMRRVAEEARQKEIEEARSAVEEHVRRVEADAEARRGELRARADADIAGIGEWERVEAERIKAEAEQRVVARRSQLEQQLSAETDRAEAEARALRDRVTEYERELEAYHAQLAEISDPAAFAAAAKRMPRPPVLEPRSGATPAAGTAAATAAAPVSGTTVAAPAADKPADTNGVTPAEPEIHPAEEEVLAGRLAELDAELETQPTTEAPAAAAPAGEPVTTEIVVSGLGSFGAITGFRQSLAGVDGIEGVALSLGQTGEFIFRATHRSGFDVGAAITKLEGEGAKIEARPDGSMHVTLDRAR